MFLIFFSGTFEPLSSRDVRKDLFESLLKEAKEDLRKDLGTDVANLNITKLSIQARKAVENKTFAYYPTSPLGMNLCYFMLQVALLKQSISG